jgi:ribosomal protein S18 acetylase RimI-like enzyme
LTSDVRSVSFDTSFLLKLDPVVDRALKMLLRDGVPCYITGTVLSEIEQLKAWGRVPPGQYELAMARWRRVRAKPIDLINRLLGTEMGRRCAAAMERYHGVKQGDIHNDCSLVVSALANGVDVFLSEDWHLTSRVTDEVLRETADGGCVEYGLMCGGHLHAIPSAIFVQVYSEKGLDLEKLETLRRDVRKPGKTMAGASELKIGTGAPADFELVWKAVQEAIERQRAEGIFQWGDYYPTRELFERDLEGGHLHIARLGGAFAGFIVLDEEQGEEWDGIPWTTKGKILVAHRLVVKPALQGRGIGGALVDFAERFGREKGYDAIRLDAYLGNPRALLIYESRGYTIAGTFKFEHLLKGFNCYEKEL